MPDTALKKIPSKAAFINCLRSFRKKNLNINRYYMCHSLDVISHTCVPPRVFLFFMKTINKVEIEIVSDLGYRSVFRLTLLFFLTSVMFSDSLSHLYV